MEIQISPARLRPRREDLNALGDRVAELLAAKGVRREASILFRSWGLAVGYGTNVTVAVFLPQSGIPAMVHIRLPAGMSPSDFAREVEIQLSVSGAVWFALPPVGASTQIRSEARERLAREHVAAIDRELALGRLGDLARIGHLEPQLRQFLGDHPDPARNVFIMMRFERTEQFTDVHNAIVAALAQHGLHGVRADDREYHPDLWSNVEVYMVGCQYGVAVFEDFERRDHNPNIAIELGYLRARGNRCLILKERTLPSVPTDIVGALYKDFDKFTIAETVAAQVNRWVTVDLGIA